MVKFLQSIYNSKIDKIRNLAVTVVNKTTNAMKTPIGLSVFTGVIGSTITYLYSRNSLNQDYQNAQTLISSQNVLLNDLTQAIHAENLKNNELRDELIKLMHYHAETIEQRDEKIGSIRDELIKQQQVQARFNSSYEQCQRNILRYEFSFQQHFGLFKHPQHEKLLSDEEIINFDNSPAQRG